MSSEKKVRVSFTGNVKKLCYGSKYERFAYYVEKKTFEDLLKVIKFNLLPLQNLLESYFSLAINPETGEISSMHPPDTCINELEKQLRQLHPFFKYTYRDVVKQSLIQYFFDILEYEYLTKGTKHEESWIQERCEHLFAYDYDGVKIEYNEIYLNAYQEYADLIGIKYDDDLEVIGINHQPQIPKGFNKLLKTQDIIRSIVFWVFDISAPKLKEVSISKRLWLYCNLFGEPDISVQSNLSFKPITLYADDNEYNEVHNNALEMNELFNKKELLKSSRFSLDHAAPSALNELDRYIAYQLKGLDELENESYLVDDLRQLLLLELLHMSKLGKRFKRCKYCGNYFIPENMNKDYCGEIAEGEKEACDIIGPRRNFKKDNERNELLTEYNKAYKRYYNRQSKENIQEAWDGFTSWQKEAADKLKAAKEGHITAECFYNWLDMTTRVKGRRVSKR